MALSGYEVETKYKATGILLSQFKAFCETRRPDHFKMVSGPDYFYSNSKDLDSFWRHRVGPDSNQLTFKRKTTGANNFVRVEHNLELKKEMSVEAIASMCKEFGYEPNTQIFKNCFIYKFNYYTMCFYICYNKDMQEIGRYIEIEMSEDYEWKNIDDAWSALLVLEKTARDLGITARNRIRSSLFELFRK
jgi:predicted adenylyl cyclase CyaB